MPLDALILSILTVGGAILIAVGLPLRGRPRAGGRVAAAGFLAIGLAAVVGFLVAEGLALPLQLIGAAAFAVTTIAAAASLLTDG